MSIQTQVLVDPMSNFDDLVALYRANWEESGIPVEFVEEDVRDFYTAIDVAGALHIAVAYEANTYESNGDAVGFCAAIVAPHPLNAKAILLSVTGIYVLPDYRKGSAAVRLMNDMRDIAKRNGCVAINWHAPRGSDYAKALADRYHPVSDYFMEVLDG